MRSNPLSKKAIEASMVVATLAALAAIAIMLIEEYLNEPKEMELWAKITAVVLIYALGLRQYSRYAPQQARHVGLGLSAGVVYRSTILSHRLKSFEDVLPPHPISYFAVILLLTIQHLANKKNIDHAIALKKALPLRGHRGYYPNIYSLRDIAIAEVVYQCDISSNALPHNVDLPPHLKKEIEAHLEDPLKFQYAKKKN